MSDIVFEDKSRFFNSVANGHYGSNIKSFKEVFKKEVNKEMTLQKLNELCVRHNIPKDVKLLSDSGWECDETEMNGVYYCEQSNVIVFTQGSSKFDYEYNNNGYGDFVRIDDREVNNEHN